MWDGGDCIDFKEKYHDCEVPYPHAVENEFCNSSVIKLKNVVGMEVTVWN